MVVCLVLCYSLYDDDDGGGGGGGVMMMMMMISCPKAGSLAFMPPWDEISEEVSCCLPHRQLWVSNLFKVATQWLWVDLNL